jgi:hypothetical protein
MKKIIHVYRLCYLRLIQLEYRRETLSATNDLSFDIDRWSQFRIESVGNHAMMASNVIDPYYERLELTVVGLVAERSE